MLSPSYVALLKKSNDSDQLTTINNNKSYDPHNSSFFNSNPLANYNLKTHLESVLTAIIEENDNLQKELIVQDQFLFKAYLTDKEILNLFSLFTHEMDKQQKPEIYNQKILDKLKHLIKTHNPKLFSHLDTQPKNNNRYFGELFSSPEEMGISKPIPIKDEIKELKPSSP